MPERFSIDEYFAEARDRDDKPLVAEEQIPALLSRVSRRHVAQRTTAQSAAAKFLPVMGAAALLLIAVLLLPDSAEMPVADTQKKAPPIPLYLYQEETVAEAPLAAEQPPVMEMKTENPIPPGLASGYAQVAPLGATAMAEPVAVGQHLITLSKDQLSRLGITATDTEASYTGLSAPRTADIARRLDLSVEQLQDLADKGNINLQSYLTPVKVTMRTNGVGTKTIEAPDNSAAPIVAPRMIGIYSEGRLLSAYWQRSDNELVEVLRQKYSYLRDAGPDSSVARLVPVHFTLGNKRDAYFKKADVVLWFEASPELVDILPEPFRSALAQETQKILTFGITGERFMENWRTTAGAVIETALYPNPVTEARGTTTLAYRLDSERQVTVTLHDIFGRELASFRTERQQPGSYTTEIPLAGRESGVYLVVLTTDKNERAVQRLLIQR